METQFSPLVSIVILAKNEERNIRKCLKNLFAQRFFDFEVILIDSGSTDNTLKIASEFPIRTERIKQKDFHHSQTRNLGISLCKGEYIVFLTADAYPLDSNWLEELLKPFKNKSIGATFSRQIPKNDTNPVERAFIARTYPEFRKEKSETLLENENPDNFVVLSDVSSAYRRKLVKFNPLIEFCEDQEMGLRILKAGYGIAYVPTSLVCHSHNYSIIGLAKRYSTVGKASSVFSEKGFNPTKSMKFTIKLFASTLSYVIRDRDNGLKIFWLCYSIIYTSVRIFGFLLGYFSNRC